MGVKSPYFWKYPYKPRHRNWCHLLFKPPPKFHLFTTKKQSTEECRTERFTRRFGDRWTEKKKGLEIFFLWLQTEGVDVGAFLDVVWSSSFFFLVVVVVVVVGFSWKLDEPGKTPKNLLGKSKLKRFKKQENNACLLGEEIIGLLRGGVPRGGGSLIFPKVPQSSLGILRVPQLPPPWTPYKEKSGTFKQLLRDYNNKWWQDFWSKSSFCGGFVCCLCTLHIPAPSSRGANQTLTRHGELTRMVTEPCKAPKLKCPGMLLC